MKFSADGITVQSGERAARSIDAENNRLVVSCTTNNFIAVIDLKSQEVIKKIKAGGRAAGINISK